MRAMPANARDHCSVFLSVSKTATVSRSVSNYHSHFSALSFFSSPILRVVGICH